MINEILLTIAGDQTVHNADSIISGWVSFKVMWEITYKQTQIESVYRNIMEKWIIKLSKLIAPFPQNSWYYEVIFATFGQLNSDPIQIFIDVYKISSAAKT